MRSNIGRRELLKALGMSSAAIVVGFDPLTRRWISGVEAATVQTFVDVPALDGMLLLDEAARAAVSGDKGNIVSHTPAAVLRPGSVEDIQRMIRYCRGQGIKVAARGQAHTMFGQSLCDGLIIENGTLNTVHSIGPAGADVDAGVRWKDLIIAAFAQGLTPPVITGYTNLSIGGTLSVGGISGRYYAGAQVDHVRSLEVVTGTGALQECSAEQHPQLFEAALAGLGQCGVITRAKIALVPAKPMVRLHTIDYGNDTATFFQDLRTLINRGELDECYSLWVPFFGTTPGYQIQALAYFDPSAPPDSDHLLRGLSVAPAVVPHVDMGYLDWILTVDMQIDFLRAVIGWDRLIKPWFDVWVPDSTAESYIGGIVSSLTVEDLGPTGFLLIFPLRRSSFTRPFFRLPHAAHGEWVYLFDVLTASPFPGPNDAYAQAMLARNRGWFEAARDAGGTRYPIGAVEFDHADWQQHYGASWPEFAKRKQRFDPDNILSPGSGIFPV